MRVGELAGAAHWRVVSLALHPVGMDLDPLTSPQLDPYNLTERERLSVLSWIYFERPEAYEAAVQMTRLLRQARAELAREGTALRVEPGPPGPPDLVYPDARPEAGTGPPRAGVSRPTVTDADWAPPFCRRCDHPRAVHMLVDRSDHDFLA